MASSDRSTFAELLNRLERGAGKEQLAPRFLEFYQKLLSIQLTAISYQLSAKIEKAVADGRLASGQPLLSFTDLSLDWSLVRDTFCRTATLFTSYPDLFPEVPRSFADIEPSALQGQAKAWYEGQPPPADQANQNREDAILLHALKPFLVQHAAKYSARVNQERWRRAYCPICGGRPDFAFLEKEAGARWLMCCRCDTEWLFQRLQCPYCGNTDQNTLSYFSDDEGKYRLYVCDRCHHYLKAVDLRHTTGEVWLPLERLLTMRLDIQAQQQGYLPM